MSLGERITNAKAIKLPDVLNEVEVHIARREGIEFLSPPLYYPITDGGYHRYATRNHFWIQWRFNAICRNLPKEWVSGRVLEVGCGRCATMELIEGYYDCQVSGCDLDLSALRLASSRSPRYFYDIHHRCKEWKNFFSVIFLLDVLEHIEDPISFLNSINFHLNIGGLLVVNVPAFPIFYSRYDAVQGHTKRYVTFSLKKELSQSGFHIERISYWGMSMLPIILLRKFIMPFCSKDKAVKVGFQPASPFIYYFLKNLMRFECAFIPQPRIGSSLLVIARKDK